MAAEIYLYNDVYNNRLVKGLNSEDTFVFGTLAQGSKYSIRYYPLKPRNVRNAPFFEQLVISGLALRIAIGPRAGTEALKAVQTTWTAVQDGGGTGTGYFTGDLDLNTTEMNALFASAAELVDSLYLEIELSDGGVRRVTYQQKLTIIAAVFDPTGASSLPTPVSSYLTRAECLAMFVKFFGNPAGAVIETTSPDGTRKRLTGVNNDGSAKDDII